jgi:hypothetical protein
MMGWTTYSNLEFQLFCYFTGPSYHYSTTYRFDFDVMQGNLALEHIENTMVFLASLSTSGGKESPVFRHGVTDYELAAIFDAKTSLYF